MRVLWVEDFGGCECEPLLLNVFALPPKRSEALARYADNLDSTKQNYATWRDWYRRQPWIESPEIDICCSEVEFDALTGNFAVDRYDAVLLDVNLTENDFFPSNTQCDPKKGGFWLYNKLIRSGFPSGRIALLTAHTGEAEVEEFRNDCLRFGHEKLEGFPKNGINAGQWIKNLANANDRYLMLRRGVLDGIDFCEGLLEKHRSEAIRFNRYLKDEDRRWTYDDALDFLYSLRHLLPVRIIGSERHLQLRGLLYVLGREWDSADPEGGSDRYYRALGRVMKLLRNMASHGSLLDNAKIRDIAFYSLASIRTAFLIPGETWAEPELFEIHLMSLIGFPTPLSPETSALFLAARASDARRKLKAGVSGKALSTTRKDAKGGKDCIRDQIKFHRIVSELVTSDKPPVFDFLAALRESFVHEALSPDDRPFNNDEGRLEELTESYRLVLQAQLGGMPPWVMAVWERLLTPAQ